jgi:hypothetical protein
MTVNERLFVAGLMDAYEQALAVNDEAKLKCILAAVDLRRDVTGAHWEINEQHNAQN